MSELPERPTDEQILEAIEVLKAAMIARSTQPAPIAIAPELFTIKETCKLLSVSRSTLHRMRERGELRPVMIDGAPRYARADIEGYLSRLRRQA